MGRDDGKAKVSQRCVLGFWLDSGTFPGIRNIEKKAYLEERKINSVLDAQSLRCLWLAGENSPLGSWIKGFGAQEIDFA